MKLCVDKNLEKGSEEKGGPLSLRKIVWEWHIVKKGLVSIVLSCQVLELILYMKGYLLSGSVMRR